MPLGKDVPLGPGHIENGKMKMAYWYSS